MEGGSHPHPFPPAEVENQGFARKIYSRICGDDASCRTGEEEEPAAGELGEEEDGQGRLPRRGGWWGERPAAAGVVAGGGGL